MLVSILSKSVRAAIEKSGFKADNIEGTIDFSNSFGDMSCSVAFRIAKEQKKNPNIVADAILSKLEKPDYVEKATVENGFINFHLDRGKFSSLLLESKTEPKRQKGRIIVEYPSVNPNKPWHVGHLRNALLGDCISNLHEKLGYEVQRQDYIDDLGLQMAEILWWYINKNGKPDKKFDHWLGEEYVKVNEHMEDPGVKEGISNMLSLMGQDGTYESNLLRTLVTECIKAQYQTAFDYSIFHELLVWESDIVKARLFEHGMEILKRSGFIETPKTGDYAGCTVINLERMQNLPEEFKGLKETAKVLIRSDGTATYLAKDIAFHMWKLGIIENTLQYSVFMEKQPNGDRLYTTSQEGRNLDLAGAASSINIIDARQSHPQSILRLVFENLGHSHAANNIRHLSYGVVELEGGTLSGRKKQWIGYTADDLLRETRAKTEELITKRFNMDKKEEARIANIVALSAIKFEFLKFGTEKNIVFSWEKALNFEGNSGPYVQYMHARASRIIEDSKAPIGRRSKMPEISDSEFALVKLISKADSMIEKAANELRPNVITDYVLELSYAFSSFYDNSPILKAATDDERAFRLRLTSAFRSTAKEMLELLGIEALERM